MEEEGERNIFRAKKENVMKEGKGVWRNGARQVGVSVVCVSVAEGWALLSETVPFDPVGDP